MGLSGNLRDMSLPNLIELSCNERRRVRIELASWGRSGVLFIGDGDVVHAECGSLRGEAAVYEMLRWEDGQFTVESGLASPQRTVFMPWQNLVLEGMRRIDEGKELTRERMRELVARISAISGVLGALVVSSDGVVLESHGISGGLEEVGAVCAFVGSSAGTVGSGLSLGRFRHCVVTVGDQRLLVLADRDEHQYVGAILASGASWAICARDAERLLAEVC